MFVCSMFVWEKEEGVSVCGLCVLCLCWRISGGKRNYSLKDLKAAGIVQDAIS